jgi:hypothetical protein
MEELYNITSEEKKMLEGIGLMLGSYQKDCDLLLYVYHSIKTIGFARKIDLMQLMSLGIPMYMILADMKNVTTPDIAHLLSGGSIPFAEISQAFQKLTEKGGIFYNPAVKQNL